MSFATGRAAVRTGMVLLLLGALAGAWELLARQAPGSPLYLGIMPEPISALRELAIVLGLLLVTAGLLSGWGFGTRPPRWFTLALCGGALTAVGAQLYGAVFGMYGVQLQDLRADALPLFVLKHLGLLAFAVAFAELVRRVLTRPPP
jgi:hypothetical protein